MNPSKKRIITLSMIIAVSLTGLNPTYVMEVVNSSLSAISLAATAVDSGTEWSSADTTSPPLKGGVAESGSNSPTPIILASSSIGRIGGIKLRVPDRLFRDPRFARPCDSNYAILCVAPTTELTNGVLLV